MRTDNRFTLNSGNITVSQSIFLDNGAGINVYGSNRNTLTLDAVVFDGIGASGDFTINTDQLVIFNAANTYSGQTRIKAGELRLGNSGGIKSGTTFFLGNSSGSANATLSLNGSSQTISNAVNVESGNTGTMTVQSLNNSGTNTLSGTLTLNKATTISAVSGGTLAVNTITGVNTSNTLTIGGAGTVKLGGTVDNTNLSINAASGTLILEKTSSGPGGLVAGVRSLGGTLTLSGGTVQIGGTGQGGSTTNVDQIYNGADVVVNSGTLDLNGRNETINGFSGTGGYVTNNATGTSTLTVGFDGATGTFAGTIQDGGSGKVLALTKTGSGTVTLSNTTNTYTGGTVVSGGLVAIREGTSWGRRQDRFRQQTSR